MTSQDQRLRGPARALLVIEHRVLADVVKLALNHGHYNTRVVQTVSEGATALADWQPHLVILDMDTGGNSILERLSDTTRQGSGVPVIALTRRGDLKAKLTAFERGVDDILTVPFSRRDGVTSDVTRAEPAVFACSERGSPADPGRDSGLPLGCRLRRGEQHRRPSHPQPAHQAPESLEAPAIHRDSSRPRLPLHADPGGSASPPSKG